MDQDRVETRHVNRFRNIQHDLSLIRRKMLVSDIFAHEIVGRRIGSLEVANEDIITVLENTQ